MLLTLHNLKGEVGVSGVLLDLMLNLEARARASAAPTPAAGPADEEVLAQLKARLEGAIRDAIATGT